MKVYASDHEVKSGYKSARAFLRENPDVASLTIQYEGANTTGRGEGWLVFARDAKVRGGVLWLGHFDTIADTNVAIREWEAAT